MSIPVIQNIGKSKEDFDWDGVAEIVFIQYIWVCKCNVVSLPIREGKMIVFIQAL